MLEQPEREPTIQEIVLALRETTQNTGRAPSSDAVGGQRAPRPSTKALLRETADKPPIHYEFRDDDHHATIDPIDTANLRDREIERLLAENARLNERVMFLLKVIERERARSATMAAGDGGTEADRSAIFQEVRRGVEAELRPILLAVLRLLEKQQANPASPAARAEAAPDVAPASSSREKTTRAEENAASRPAARMTAPSKWLSELIRNLEDQGEAGMHGEAAATIGAVPS